MCAVYLNLKGLYSMLGKYSSSAALIKTNDSVKGAKSTYTLKYVIHVHAQRTEAQKEWASIVQEQLQKMLTVGGNVHVPEKIGEWLKYKQANPIKTWSISVTSLDT